jgi:hypothetical protein
MISIWLFGTTAGFEIQTIGPVMPVTLIKEWVSLPPEIELNNNGVIGVTRRNVDGKIVTWIGVYRTIFEIGYQRRGGFYGAGIWIVDQLVDANIVVPILTKLTDQIQLSAINNNQFYKRISEINPKISLSTHEAQLLANSTEPFTNSGLSTLASQSAYIATATSITNLINLALKSEEARIFKSIYCGDSSQLVKNSHSFVKMSSWSEIYEPMYHDLKKQNQQLNLQSQQLIQQIQKYRLELDATNQSIHSLQISQGAEKKKYDILFDEKERLELELKKHNKQYNNNSRNNNKRSTDDDTKEPQNLIKTSDLPRKTTSALEETKNINSGDPLETNYRHVNNLPGVSLNTINLILCTVVTVLTLHYSYLLYQKYYWPVPSEKNIEMGRASVATNIENVDPKKGQSDGQEAKKTDESAGELAKQINNKSAPLTKETAVEKQVTEGIPNPNDGTTIPNTGMADKPADLTVDKQHMATPVDTKKLEIIKEYKKVLTPLTNYLNRVFGDQQFQIVCKPPSDNSDQVNDDFDQYICYEVTSKSLADPLSNTVLKIKATELGLICPTLTRPGNQINVCRKLYYYSGHLNSDDLPKPLEDLLNKPKEKVSQILQFCGKNTINAVNTCKK